MKTSKENILTIAPELTTFCSNIRQSVKVTILTAEDSRDYVLTIDGVIYSINSTVSSTVESIAAQMKTEIDAASIEINVVDNTDGSLTLTSFDAGIRFDIDADTDSYISIELITVAHLGENLVSLVLNDVNLECKYGRYKEEQEVAQRYLAAHRLSVMSLNSALSAGTAGDIIREKVGDVETWFSDQGSSTDVDSAYLDLSTTKYGKVFIGIRSRHSTCFV